MGPQDELSTFDKRVQSNLGTIGANAKPAVPFLTPREQDPLGGGMTGWSADHAGQPSSRRLTPPLAGSRLRDVGTIGPPTQTPVGILDAHAQNPFGGMAGGAGTLGPKPAPNGRANGPNGDLYNTTLGRPPVSVFTTLKPPIPYLRPTPQDKPGGILGMLIDAGRIDPANPDQPPPGGLLGLIQDYLLSNPGAGR
jgi:hypothetical protein